MNDYADKQTQRDAQHQRNLDAWFASLSPQEQEAARAMGLHKAPRDFRLRNGHADVSECDLAAPEVEDEPEHPLDSELPDEVLKECLFLIIDAGENSRLTAECLSLAMGYDASKCDSMSQIGERYGQSRAAVSKRVKLIQERLNLPPSHHMKSEHACEAYRLTNQPRQ